MKIVFAHEICIREPLRHNHTKKDNRSIPNQILDETSQKNFNLSLAAKLRKLYLLALFRENDLFDRQLLALFG